MSLELEKALEDLTSFCSVKNIDFHKFLSGNYEDKKDELLVQEFKSKIANIENIKKKILNM